MPPESLRSPIRCVGLAALSVASIWACGVGYAVAGSLDSPHQLDVGYAPTPHAAVKRMLELAKAEPDDYLIDLGSGDGRIVIAAVRDRGVRRAVGIDLDPWWLEIARERAREAGVEDSATFEQGDLFEKDLSGATVLTMYLLPELNLRLKPTILETLAAGSRVVSHAFDMGRWEPDVHEEVARRNVFLWIVPAQVSGDWILERPGDLPVEISFEQNFQRITGHATIGGNTEPISGAQLDGVSIRFTMGGEHYRGRVDGDAISPVADAGEAKKGWRAFRSR